MSTSMGMMDHEGRDDSALGAGGLDFHYPHPYEVEVRAFHYMPRQVCNAVYFSVADQCYHAARYRGCLCWESGRTYCRGGGEASPRTCHICIYNAHSVKLQRKEPQRLQLCRYFVVCVLVGIPLTLALARACVRACALELCFFCLVSYCRSTFSLFFFINSLPVRVLDAWSRSCCKAL